MQSMQAVESLVLSIDIMFNWSSVFLCVWWPLCSEMQQS